MPEFGFCGAAYQSQSVNANAQKCANLYLERDESGTGKSKFQLLCTPGTKTFARLYDDIAGLAVAKASYQGTSPVMSLAAGFYYAALVLLDVNGSCIERSRVFGPFGVRVTNIPHSPPFVQTFAAHVPAVPPPGAAWYIYFGTNRTNLNQRLALGSANPITQGGSFLSQLPAAPDYIVDPGMGYVITANGLAQPIPGTGPSWYVLLNGPVQGDQSASITIPHFDTSHSTFSVGVLARAQGKPQALTSYYEVGLSASNPQIAIYKVVNGVASVIASQASIAIPDGSVLTISVVGSTVTASLNGVVILTVVDGTLVSGTTGFITTGPAISTFISSTTPSALSLTVTAPGAAATLPDVDTPNGVFSGIEKDGRCFVTSQTGFWELFADGYASYIGGIVNDFGPKPLASSNIQILLASGGHCYLLTLGTNVFQEILTDGTTALQAPIVSVGFSDGFFIALLNDGRFQISGILDGTAWDPNDIDKVSVFPDNPVAMIVDHREIIVGGRKQGQVYYDSGNPLFPFDVVPGGFTENGVGAPASLVKADNTVFWVGQDERGGGMAWRAEGYKPSRVSTHAIEEHWRKFDTFADARSWSYQEAGHTYVVFYFPRADETWVFDVAIGAWHERTGKSLQCHVFFAGKHLVGDAKTGAIYEQSIDLLTHDGKPIRRVRRAPHISKENVRMPHSEFRLDMEAGLGPEPPLLDADGHPRGPEVMLRWSDDGGHTWSNIYAHDCGRAGEYKKRVRWTRLGSSRDRVYEVSASDPIPYRFINAYLNPE